MKVIEFLNFGSAKELQIGERPLPEIKNNEVLIKVYASGVNRPDIIQRLGKYPPPEGVTDILGLEVSGVVEKSKSSQWKVGDKICALLPGGGYAQYAVANEDLCLPIPNNLDFVQAASLPETIFTVYNNLILLGHLKRNERVLIHGGSSGIGVMGIQVARYIGASNIIITAGSDKKCIECQSLGATHTINYKTKDFVAEVIEETSGQGVNLVLDMVGGDYVAKNIKCLSENGRHISIAFLNGIKAEINIKEIMSKKIMLTGSTLRARPLKEKKLIASGVYKEMWPAIESGEIKPIIFKTLPLEDAAQAHQILERSEHIGKVVLTILDE
jgi:NADPH2:quinone reductase